MRTRPSQGSGLGPGSLTEKQSAPGSSQSVLLKNRKVAEMSLVKSKTECKLTGIYYLQLHLLDSMTWALLGS